MMPYSTAQLLTVAGDEEKKKLFARVTFIDAALS